MAARHVRRACQVIAVALGITYAVRGVDPGPFVSAVVMVLAGLRVVWVAYDAYEAHKKTGSRRR